MKPPSRLFSPNTRWQCDRCNQTFRRRELRCASLGEATLLCERCRAPREIRTEPCGCQVQYRQLGGAWEEYRTVTPCAMHAWKTEVDPSSFHGH